jgi:hypothetical protein
MAFKRIRACGMQTIMREMLRRSGRNMQTIPTLISEKD